MRKPVYFINKYHKSNYQRLLKINGPDKPEFNASAYILASIGILNNNEGEIPVIEKCYLPNRIDYEALLAKLGNNPSDRALIKLAANLFDSNNYANVNLIFTPMDDVYQAVAYQALLLQFPSFSKTWDSRYPFSQG